MIPAPTYLLPTTQTVESDELKTVVYLLTEEANPKLVDGKGLWSILVRMR